MAGAHADALRRLPGVEVAAIAGHNEDRARAVAQAYGIPKAYGDPFALIMDRNIQAIHNCMYNDLHFGLNKAALEAGKHVLSEKPLALNSGETAQLVKAVERSELVAAVNFAYRYYPMVQQMAAMIRDGSVGPLHLAFGEYLQDWLLHRSDYNWRVDPARGGPYRALADIGSHWCDLAQYVTGQRITHVCGQKIIVHGTRRQPDVQPSTFESNPPRQGKDTPVMTEDVATALVRFEGGAAGIFVVSQVSAGHKNGLVIELNGASGALRWNQEEPERLWVGRRDGANEILLKDPNVLSDRAREFAHYPGGHPEGYPDSFRNLFADVYEHIADRRAPARFPTFHEAHRITRLVEAIGASNEEGSWIEVKT